MFLFRFAFVFVRSFVALSDCTAEAQQQLQAKHESSRTEQTRFEARIRELQAAQAEFEQKIIQLNAALGEESKLRKAAEGQAGEIGQRRNELEAGLLENQKAQAQLRAELALVGTGAVAVGAYERYVARLERLPVNEFMEYFV